MCGIIGAIGTHEAAPILVEALKRLEYRGYDSAGIATLDNGALHRRRAVGKLVNLSDLLVHQPISGQIGIGHTRWATHGAPTEGNAHPHRAGPVAVVHNGIIENYRALREELAEAGLACETETDTETVALLARHHLAQGLDPADAAAATVARLEGAFALLFLFEGEEELLVAARRGPPLAIGHGEGEMFVGSDAIALAPLTQRITYLEEGDMALVTRSGAEIRDAGGQAVNRPPRTVEITRAQLEKGGHRHFMAKEIAEQPVVLGELIGHMLDREAGAPRLPDDMPDLAGVERIVLVACGTAAYACQVAKYWIESLAGVPVEADIASEYRYREAPVGPGTLAIMVSQSGETADTLAALRHLKGRAAHILGVVNAAESSIAREADLALPIHAGVEIGVASTKAFTCQLTTLLFLAIAAGRRRGRLDAERTRTALEALAGLPARMNVALAIAEEVRAIAADLAEMRHTLFLGRGPLFPLAMEGALKLKEISYIHAEGYASGELKHGPIALIDHDMPVVVLAPHDALFAKTVSNMQEVMARGARVVLITDAAGAAEAPAPWRTLILPDTDPLLAPVLHALPVQLLAYHTAVAKGTDVDQPRNLAKSVTVE